MKRGCVYIWTHPLFIDPYNDEKETIVMNDYIFLTDQGHTFQPGDGDEMNVMENLQAIGFAQGTNADVAYENLLSENPYLIGTSFERIFCYLLAREYEKSRKDYTLRVQRSTMKKKYPKLKSEKVMWKGDRIIGCQSNNHTMCKGELWECERCHKSVCWEEGYADELVDLCDDCWYDIQVLGQKFSIGNLSTWRLDYEAI